MKESDVLKAAKVLSLRDRKRIAVVILLQISFSILDLLGVALIGVIGALAVRGVNSQQPGDRVSNVLTFLNLEHKTFQEQVAILALAACFVLVLRTVLSITFTRRTLRFLALRGALITRDLFSKLISQNLVKIQEKSAQESLYALTNGVSIIVIGIIGIFITIVSDTALLMVLSIGIFLVDPITALIATLFFGLIGFLMYRFLHKRVKELGSKDYQLNILSNQGILEVLMSYRENFVKNRRSYYVEDMSRIRSEIAMIQSELSFVPYISKYVIETAVVLGAVVVSGFQFMVNDSSRAVATLAIFIAAGTRIAPAVLRVQQGAIHIKGNLAVATPTFELINSLKDIRPLNPELGSFTTEHNHFKGEVSLESVYFRYPNAEKYALNNLSVRIPEGESAVIVGSSGAGKTTLVDAILGIIKPSEGRILISGVEPELAIAKWPGAIAYVPQDVMITNQTIEANVSMGFEPGSVPESAIWDALEMAQIAAFVRSLPEGLKTPVQDRGTRLSGGQRQRIGIARALLSKPKLLVLDEATSSLDGETEANISDAIQNLHGQVTVILIAHRLSSVRSANHIIYLENGEILAEGNFSKVRNLVPNFDKQANLMGL